MADYLLILSRGAGFSPCTAHVIASDGSIADAGHTFYPVKTLIEALESVGVETGAFQMEINAINSSIRTWIPLNEQQARAFIALTPKDRSW